MLQYPTKEERETYDEDSFEEMLNIEYGDVEICGMSFASGSALKELDPTAFRCALNDMQEYEEFWICPMCNEEHTDEEYALECCQTVYECEECYERYDNEDDAENCCKVEEEEE